MPNALLQVVIIAFAVLLYFGSRGFTDARSSVAFHNAREILNFEGMLYIDFEQSLQAWALNHSFLIDAVNIIYIFGHWPVIVLTLVWLLRRHSSWFLVLRNALFISGAIGLIIFVLFPLAPPRFMPGYVDTVTQETEAYRILQPPSLVNKYAAMPSLHFGWNLLLGVVAFLALRNKLGLTFMIVSPLLMLAAILLTGNHYIVDAIVGGTVAMAGLILSLILQSYKKPNKKPETIQY